MCPFITIRFYWRPSSNNADCEKMDVEEVFIPESQCSYVVSIIQGLYSYIITMAAVYMVIKFKLALPMQAQRLFSP